LDLECRYNRRHDFMVRQTPGYVAGRVWRFHATTGVNHELVHLNSPKSVVFYVLGRQQWPICSPIMVVDLGSAEASVRFLTRMVLGSPLCDGVCGWANGRWLSAAPNGRLCMYLRLHARRAHDCHGQWAWTCWSAVLHHACHLFNHLTWSPRPPPPTQLLRFV